MNLGVHDQVFLSLLHVLCFMKVQEVLEEGMRAPREHLRQFEKYQSLINKEVIEMCTLSLPTSLHLSDLHPPSKLHHKTIFFCKNQVL